MPWHAICELTLCEARKLRRRTIIIIIALAFFQCVSEAERRTTEILRLRLVWWITKPSLGVQWTQHRASDRIWLACRSLTVVVTSYKGGSCGKRSCISTVQREFLWNGWTPHHVVCDHYFASHRLNQSRSHKIFSLHGYCNSICVSLVSLFMDCFWIQFGKAVFFIQQHYLHHNMIPT